MVEHDCEWVGESSSSAGRSESYKKQVANVVVKQLTPFYRKGKFTSKVAVIPLVLVTLLSLGPLQTICKKGDRKSVF